MKPSIAPLRPTKGLIVKLGILAVVAGAAGVLVLSGFDWRSGIETGLAWVREAGPWVFFGAMAVLPAMGFPLSPFTLGAAPAFSSALGLPVVIAAACAAIFVNVMITYSLARWLLRPWLEKLVVRLGYRMPEVGPGNYWDVSVLLRVTPGPPFFLQSCLLGLGQVPVGIYLVVSLAVAWSYAVAFIIFGDALLHGRGRMLIGAASLFVALAVAAQLVRKHLARKKALQP